MLYNFTLKKTCPIIKGVHDSAKCARIMKDTLKEKFNLIKEHKRYNFSLRIIHEQNNHLICLFLCDKNGIEESISRKIDKNCSDKINYDAKINYLINKEVVKCGIIINSLAVKQPYAVKIIGKIPTKDEIIKAL